MTPTEMSRLLGREQWADTDEIHAALDTVSNGELTFLKIVADQHPQWVQVSVKLRDAGRLDDLADMGLIVCDPLDASCWRVHPRVVRVLAMVERNYKAKYGVGPFDDLVAEAEARIGGPLVV